MLRCRTVAALTLAGLMTGLTGLVFAQDAAPGAPPAAEQPRQRPARNQNRTPEEIRQRLEEARSRMLDNLRTQIGATDQEWLVLKPLIQNVQTVVQQSGAARMMGGNFGGNMGGRRGGQPGAAPGADAAAVPGGEVAAVPGRELSEVEKATQDLRTVLANKDAKPEEIEAKLIALRQAVEKQKQALILARETLKNNVTTRQEAALVLLGLLE